MSTPTLIVIGSVAFSASACLLMVTLFFWGMRRRPAGDVPAWKVSILKPLAGHDDELAENLESFARLEGVEYELLLGVARKTDPAWAAAEVFVAAHPELDVRLVPTNPDAALNPKVAQLMGLERAATGEVLVVSDSNVRVRPDYLANVLRELSRPGVALVSNAIMGSGERTVGAALENLMLGAHVTPGVIGALVLTGRSITIGKSLVMRRVDLDALGGFACVANHLAEDHALARMFAAIGRKVTVSSDTVENRVVASSIKKAFDRHVRWSQIRRANAPAGLFAEPFLYPFGVAVVGALLVPGALTYALVGGAALFEVVMARVLVRRLRGSWGPWWLSGVELLRPGFFFACWIIGWASRHVEWRGHYLTITTGTELVPAQRSGWRRFASALLPR